MWLLLTSTTGDKIRYNFDTVLMYQAHKSGGTRLTLAHENVVVQETSDELDFLCSTLSIESMRAVERKMEEFLSGALALTNKDEDSH